MKIRKICELNKMTHSPDSHAKETKKSHLEADRRSYTVIDGKDSACFSSRVYYPRIKMLSDGTYIMFHQDGRVSGNCFYTKSKDGLTWTERRVLFKAYTTVRDDGENDKIFYCNADAVVMPDGEILAFCSYRYCSGYNLHAKYCGIVMRRSKDNGESWTQEKEIYLGRNWESAPLLLKSGELQLYFSHTAPKFYYDKTVKTDSKIHTSSGSALIRSFDGGHTWTPDVKEPPYAAHRVTQNYVETMENGTKCFTNQMPVAVELNCGDIALATESDMARGRFMLTMSYTHDNWARPLGIDEDGPEDKEPAFDFGAGPYIVQFKSGETLLSYNTADQFHLRLGNEYGKDMSAERDIIAFDGNPGYWGCLCVDSTHRVLAAMPYVIEDRTTRPWTSENDMMLCRYYLNHRINAPMCDSDAFSDAAWEKSDDALFLGAETDAQLSLGFMHDRENIYLRIDRLDKTPNEKDAERIYVSIGDKVYSVLCSDTVSVMCDGEAVECDFKTEKICKCVTDDMGEWGRVSVISIKKPADTPDTVKVYAELDDADDASIVSAGFVGVNKEDTDSWFDVALD